MTHEAAVRGVCEIQRHVASAEVHLPPPVQEEEQQARDLYHLYSAES